MIPLSNHHVCLQIDSIKIRYNIQTYINIMTIYICCNRNPFVLFVYYEMMNLPAYKTHIKKRYELINKSNSNN